MFNKQGIRFVHERTTPMAVNSMDDAAAVIAKKLAERDARIAAGKPLRTDNDLKEVGRHLAWVIGFDHLIDDRKEINAITKLIIEETK